MQLIERFATPDEAERGILELLSKKKVIMGFGHRVYTTKDPRSALIYAQAKQLAVETRHLKLMEIGERIESVMLREKNLFPNVDFYSALAYHFMDIPTHFFTPIFVMSRISGWSAHYFEQKSHNKLIRPLSHYVGPSFRHVL
jgi:2-methylcitrate synthase